MLEWGWRNKLQYSYLLVKSWKNLSFVILKVTLIFMRTSSIKSLNKYQKVKSHLISYWCHFNWYLSSKCTYSNIVKEGLVDIKWGMGLGFNHKSKLSLWIYHLIIFPQFSQFRILHFAILDDSIRGMGLLKSIYSMSLTYIFTRFFQPSLLTLF